MSRLLLAALAAVLTFGCANVADSGRTANRIGLEAHTWKEPLDRLDGRPGSP